MALDQDPALRGASPDYQDSSIEKVEQESVFYSSLQAALTPYVGPEEATRISSKAPLEGGIYHEDFNKPVTPARDRLLPTMTMEQAEQRALGIDVERGSETVKVLTPARSIPGIPTRVSDAELRALQRWYAWSGKQQVYRYVVQEGEQEKVRLLSFPEIEMYGVKLNRVERYEEHGDPRDPRFTLTYDYYNKVEEKESTPGTAEPSLTGERLEIVDQGNIRTTKITRPVEGGQEIIYCSMTNKITGETFVRSLRNSWL